MTVDVIVPCYRYGRFLRECVKSVLTQSHREIRILIIDDASPDDSAEIAACLARQDRRVAFRRHSENRGHIATYNEGIEWASGECLLLLSADDYLLPGALSRAVSVLQAHPDVGMVFGKAVEMIDGGSPPLMAEAPARTCLPNYRILSGKDFIESNGCRNPVATPAVVVRAALQKQLGGYRPELPHTGDMEMWLRFAAHAPVGILAAYQAVYRRHSGNMSLSYLEQSWLPDLQQRRAALEWFFETHGYRLSDQDLRRRLLRQLSVDAVKRASVSFNERLMDASQELSAFSAAICPEVRRSSEWIKLSCKRILGYTAWSAVRKSKIAASRLGRRIGIPGGGSPE